MVGKINSLILLLLFLSCGSIYLFLFGGEFLLLSLLALAIFSFIANQSYNIQLLKHAAIAIFILSIILIFNWLITGFSLSYIEYPKYLLRIFVVNFAMFVLYNHSNLSYKSFEWLFKLVVVHAFLNFLLGFILSPFFITVSSPEGFQASSLFYCFFYMAKVSVAGVDFFRNQGFFWEPGVLGFILNIYLFILLLNKTDAKRKFTWISTICFLIITTFSTTGLGLMVLQFCIYFFKNQFTIKKLAVLVLSAMILVPIFISNLNEKTSGTAEGSYIIRYYDSLIALDIVRNNPLVGVGLSAAKYNLEQTKYPRFFQSDLEEGKPSTNSILALFASFGIPLGLLTLYALYKQRIIPYNRKLIFCFLLIFLASEPLLLSSFFMMFISSVFYKENGYQKDSSPKQLI